MTMNCTYRGYLIRFSSYALTLGRAAYWVERDGVFVCGATDLEHAKQIVNNLTRKVA